MVICLSILSLHDKEKDENYNVLHMGFIFSNGPPYLTSLVVLKVSSIPPCGLPSNDKFVLANICCNEPPPLYIIFFHIV